MSTCRSAKELCESMFASGFGLHEACAWSGPKGIRAEGVFGKDDAVSKHIVKKRMEISEKAFAELMREDALAKQREIARKQRVDKRGCAKKCRDNAATPLPLEPTAACLNELPNCEPTTVLVDYKPACCKETGKENDARTPSMRTIRESLVSYMGDDGCACNACDSCAFMRCIVSNTRRMLRTLEIL